MGTRASFDGHRHSDPATRLHAQLEESLRGLVTSEDWLAALDVARRFHDYSFANTRLIWAQGAARGFTPTRVAGYRTWQSLGRQVRSGESGIAILAPIVRRLPTIEQPDPERENTEAERCLVGFRAVYVFDISQTDGPPLSEVKPTLVAGDLPGRWVEVADLIERQGFDLDVSQDPRLDEANGVTIWSERKVVVRSTLPGAQRYKTALHELAHIRLHDPKAGERPACRGVVEVEAESVAYIISAATGIDSAGYSLPYVATWSGGNLDMVAATAHRVVGCAGAILDELELARSPEQQLTPARLGEGHPTTQGRGVTVETSNSLDRISEPAAVADPRQLGRSEQTLERAISFYHDQLSAPGGRPARRYLEKRGIAPETIERFDLGWAPPTWDSLLTTMRAAGVTEHELLQVGLVGRARTDRLYDRMRGRIVFPVYDQDGRPRGLAGRRLEGDGPKYLNTPETPLYKKSRLLYGLHHALPAIQQTGRAVVVEGYTDTIAVHQAGIDNTVATGGTALTEHHLATLGRHAPAVTLMFDGDEGGTSAAARVWNLAIETRSDLSLRVATLPARRDPADLVAAGQGELLHRAVSDSNLLAHHLIDQAVAAHDLTEPEGSLWAVRSAVAIIAAQTNRENRNAAIAHLARRVGHDFDAVEAVLARYSRPRVNRRRELGRVL